MPPDYLSPSAYADHRGVDRSRVSRYIKAGQIPPKAIDGTGRAMRIHVALADAALDRVLDKGQQLAKALKADRPAATTTPPPVPSAPQAASRRPRPPTPKPAPPTPAPAPSAPEDDPDPAEPDYTFEKARLAKAQADAQEMKNALARGENAPVADAARVWGEAVARARSAFLALPRRFGDRFPQLGPADVAAIDADLRAILTELGRVDFLA